MYTRGTLFLLHLLKTSWVVFFIHCYCLFLKLDRFTIFPWAVRIDQDSLAVFWDTLLILLWQKITQHLICFAIQCTSTFSSGTNIRLNAFTAVNYWRSGPLHLYWWHNYSSLPVGRHRNFELYSTVGHCWAKIDADSSLCELACLAVWFGILGVILLGFDTKCNTPPK